MYRSLFLLSALMTLSSLLYCQFPYNISSVPEALKKEAAVVYHLENYELSVSDIDHYSMDVHKVYTVLNEDGKMRLFFNEYTTKYRSIDNVEIKVYDGSGRQIAKFKKKDLRTQSVGEGLVEDLFMLYSPLPHDNYPVTVDLEYVINSKSTIDIPDFRFVDSKESVVEANFLARVPPAIGLRFKPVNFSGEPVIGDDGKYKTYKWSAKNVAAVDYEEDGMAAADRTPHVILAPEHFSYYGREGDLSTWKNFGLWLRDLYSNLDVLPPDRQQFFQDLVKDAPNDREKTRRIYRYMQENFRYVSIQLGVGGLKPFPADFTDKKKYGDCKGLSNFMKAALKSVGIQSCIAIINSGYNSEPVDPNFPANGFNHAILCVPGASDSIWLECTSQTIGFGELGTNTENRNALLITDEGGALVPTPISKSADNKLSIVTHTALQNDLSCLLTSSFEGSGYYGEILSEMLKLKRDEQKAALISVFGARQPDEFQLARPAGSSKTEVKMSLSKMPDFAAGSKLFLAPRTYRLWPTNLPKSENRSSDFYFYSPYEKTDTTIISLPQGITPDALPPAKQLSCPYASYHSNYWYNEKEGSVYIATVIVLKKHKIPANDYAVVKKFFDDIAQETAQKLVVTRNESPKKGF